MNIKKTFLIGGLALISAYSLYGLTKPRWDTNAGESLTAVLRAEVSEPKDEQYMNVSKSVDELLKNKPEYANALVQKCVQTMESTNIQYQPRTSMMMFEAVRKKAEETPELANYLGVNAKAYIRGMRTTCKELTGRIKQALGDAKEKIREIYECVKPKHEEV